MKIIIAFILLMTSFLNSQFTKHMVTDNIKFVSGEEAKILMTTDDSFTKSWSQFDIDSRLGKSGSTKDELFDHIRKQVLDWTDKEKADIKSIVSDILNNINELKLKINFPDKILFVKTTSQEEGGAFGYTRENYIVLSKDIKSASPDNLKRLIAHELFHVLSRHDRSFKKKMYEIIGFKLMENIAYPKGLKELRITNPDATLTDSYITVMVEGEQVDCTMILYASKEYEGGSFFKYLNVGFLKLIGDDIKMGAIEAGLPVIYKQNELSNFIEQVGQNTGYMIHPEEIMADNFSFAVLRKSDLKSPEIVEKIIATLQE
ncbi:MAG: hypothetical protein HKO66_12565 [Saprospiraceae bacterium]|nr:hypothetical protein [Bacteroidia bacterium]NNE13561.1 hypothetical protein [Saprospiraceae bacterium]NNL93063.1 hypothetical protein [Saprospiraceae bacterium]